MTNRDVSHTHPAQPRGFTLVELMVTVAVVAILMAIGAPQLRSFLQKQQVAADIDAIGTALSQARSEALKRSGTVTVCALSGSTFSKSEDAQCAASTSTDWSHGWMVFLDYATSGSYEKGTDTVLHIEQTVRSGSINNASKASITYQANGLPSGGINQGTFFISPSANNAADDPLCLKLVISAQGRMRKAACKSVANAATSTNNGG
ncbi:MAG: GspH/FimT family pseudopilin [Aquabacterium sp.]